MPGPERFDKWQSPASRQCSPQRRGRLLDCMALSLASWLCCVSWHHFGTQMNHGAAHSYHEALLSHVYCNGYCDNSLDLNSSQVKDCVLFDFTTPTLLLLFSQSTAYPLFCRGMHPTVRSCHIRSRFSYPHQRHPLTTASIQ
ncbi:hypothetical protein FVEG_14700 [Fusarium verticillioides 7600]|uniref:Uncharacterized protein n=1 Tax=Gibberella moniliformis (strain M3125 / FGSC 7600) TaxID=334819 RepID=W7LVX5_GIBM7|nr:hypothetical protein FVEG_14700 [Fusarium verticillioides 7600]EWG36707.1 hypothetical protein FVEG_14700 [Fusarium verticillioides 7600]